MLVEWQVPVLIEETVTAEPLWEIGVITSIYAIQTLTSVEKVAISSLLVVNDPAGGFMYSAECPRPSASVRVRRIHKAQQATWLHFSYNTVFICSLCPDQVWLVYNVWWKCRPEVKLRKVTVHYQCPMCILMVLVMKKMGVPGSVWITGDWIILRRKTSTHYSGPIC